MSDPKCSADATSWFYSKLLEKLLPAQRGDGDAVYAGPIQRVLQNLRSMVLKLRHERREAVRRVDELLKHPPSLQEERIRRSFHRLKHRAVGEELLRRAHHAIRTDPLESERLGELSYLALREILSEERVQASGGARRLATSKARVLGHLGNVARINERWEQSFQWFAGAFGEWEKGTGDAESEADLFYLYSSLLRDRQHYGAALRALDSAQSIYGEIGEDHLRGLALIKRATVLSGLRETTQALQAHLEGVFLLDEERAPEAAVNAWVNLAEYYRQLGRIPEASEALENAVEPVHALSPNSSAVLCFVWVSGRVALAQGDWREAEAKILHVGAAFAERGQEYDRGLAGLDLMKLYALEARLEDLLKLAEPTVEALSSQGLAPEALEAVRLLARAVERREVEAQLIDHVAETLGRCGSWSKPQ